MNNEGLEIPDIGTVSGGDAGYVDGGAVTIPVVGEDGLLRVVISGDESEEIALSAADAAAMGYQVSDYWLEYYRGVLQKLGDVDYCIFSTREYDSGSGYNYVQHTYMYVAPDMGDDTIQPGTYTCYDAYAVNGVYYVDVRDGYLGDVETGKLMYSNIGQYSDIRQGVSHVDSWAILFFLGFFVVYNVAHDIFDYVMEHVYRK